MNNINRDYLIKVNTRTAKLTPAPKELKFFMTDVWTSNIFFELEPKESISDLIANKEPYQNANAYTLTLRVVKPNGEPKTIKAIRLESHNLHVADLTVDFVDIPGIYQCELFIDAETIDEDGILRLERNTTDPFEYRVERSIFYNLDDIIDTKILAIEDIATVDYVNSLAVGGVSLEGYATTEQLNTKADEEHTHDDYITQTQFNEAMAGIGAANINLTDFVASNSISINRKENTVIGQYSTAEGYETIASGDCSHAEGNNTIASNYNSHAEGTSTIASGDSSHAEGYNTLASGAYSHAEGYYTAARSAYQHVQGKYNIEDTDRVYAHIVGNGTDEDNRSNAHTLDWDGNAWFAGDVKVGTENKILATEDYVNGAVANVSYDDTELRGLIANKADSDHTHSDILVTNNPVGSTITLTTDKYQISNITANTTITLPAVTNYTEIHLFFTPTADVTLTLPSGVKNQNAPNIEANKTYEFIFTYIGTWLCGVVVYE